MASLGQSENALLLFKGKYHWWQSSSFATCKNNILICLLESNLVKLETSQSVIVPLWLYLSCVSINCAETMFTTFYFLLQWYKFPVVNRYYYVGEQNIDVLERFFCHIKTISHSLCQGMINCSNWTITNRWIYTGKHQQINNLLRPDSATIGSLGCLVIIV